MSSAVASRYTAMTESANRGKRPALTSDDLPQPDGP